MGSVLVLLAAAAAPIAKADLDQPVPADEILLFEEDGTGFNPTTLGFNNWSFNTLADWQVGVMTNQVAAFPDYAGTQAALDMLAALGANNDLIIADVFQNGTVSITSPAFTGITPTNGTQLPNLFFVQEAVTALPSLVRATYLFDAFRITAKDITVPQPPPGQPHIIRIKVWSEMHVIRRQQTTTGALLDHADALGELRAAGIEATPFVTTNTVQFFQMPEVDVAFDIDLAVLNTIAPEWISTMRLQNIPEPATATILTAGLILTASARQRERSITK